MRFVVIVITPGTQRAYLFFTLEAATKGFATHLELFFKRAYPDTPPERFQEVLADCITDSGKMVYEEDDWKLFMLPTEN